MKYPNFCGGTYTGESPTPACDRAINLEPERIQGAGAPENSLLLNGTAGLKTFAALSGTSISALYSEPVTGRAFAVGGGALYEILSNGTTTKYGALPPGPYSFGSSNSLQMMIACAGTGAGYIFDLTANTLSQITNSEFNGSNQVAMIDDYFIALTPNSREFQISSLLDGTQWDGLDFGASSGGPDNVTAFNASHRELWLFTQTRGDIYIDDGSANFPFDRLYGVSIDCGISAPQTLLRLDNTLFWLGQDERGAGVVWRANGYTPQRISNHSVEWFFREYAKQGALSNATAYAYQDNGHSYYVLNFPNATCEPSGTGGMTQGVRLGATWVYDVSSGMWHERAYWNVKTGQWQSHLGANCHCYAFGLHLVGDYQSGNIYSLSTDSYDDNGALIKRVRRAPHITSELKEIYYHELTVNMETGDGNANDPNPECFLRFTDDGGKTWSNERPASLGAAGNYLTRVKWNMLGKSRRRAYEFSTTARVPICLVDAYFEATKGLS